jgi:hypothetical protein
MRLWLPLLLVLSLAHFTQSAEPSAEGIEFFENKIRPILAEHCYSCHGEKKQKGSLRVDQPDALLKGGDSGTSLVPNKPAESLLLKALKHEGDVKMPPKNKLDSKVVADFEKWIAQGAPMPKASATTSTTSIDWKQAKTFWSFQPITKPAVPPGGSINPIDRFILAKLKEQGLQPSPRAERRALVRRLTFDLTGLPPTPEEIEAFLKDESAEATTKLVDRLLQSPAYGEMQARQWMDVARYAEDQAHTFGVKPNSEAWRYRDWLIESFNADMPYDRFVRLQIAADLIVNNEADLKHRAALGYFGLGAIYYKDSEESKKIAVVDELDDRVDTLSRGFLGLTVSCARCHDHKFDPIPTKDYYSLAGIFWSSRITDLPLVPQSELDRIAKAMKIIADADEKAKKVVQSQREEIALGKTEQLVPYVLATWKLEAKRVSKPDVSFNEIAKADKLDGQTLDRMTKFLKSKGNKLAPMKEWTKNLPKKEANTPTPEVEKMAQEFKEFIKGALVKADTKDRTEILLGLYGDKGVFPITDAEAIAAMKTSKKTEYNDLKKEHAELAKKAPTPAPVAHALQEAKPTDMHILIRGNHSRPGELAPRGFLHVLSSDDAKPFQDGSGRKQLAEAIADPRNPLTPRVIVNRVWQQHFGRGIVGTPSNFGSLGERPTHPELLDYLAATFIEEGWSLKKLHRRIVLSETYQQAALSNPANEEKDAINKYLWRANRRRLGVEAWRDALLAVTGQLDRTTGGPTTNLESGSNVRRTVYAKISRHELNSLLRLFDFPDANITSEKRVETTVPQQQLFVMNSPFIIARAKALAAKLEKETDSEQIRRGYELTLGRPASAEEISLGVQYLGTGDLPEESSKNKLSRRERYFQALLASNEFLYID